MNLSTHHWRPFIALSLDFANPRTKISWSLKVSSLGCADKFALGQAQPHRFQQDQLPSSPKSTVSPKKPLDHQSYNDWEKCDPCKRCVWFALEMGFGALWLFSTLDSYFWEPNWESPAFPESLNCLCFKATANCLCFKATANQHLAFSILGTLEPIINEILYSAFALINFSHLFYPWFCTVHHLPCLHCTIHRLPYTARDTATRRFIAWPSLRSMSKLSLRSKLRYEVEIKVEI